jgi:hypothetical protein
VTNPLQITVSVFHREVSIIRSNTDIAGPASSLAYLPPDQIVFTWFFIGLGAAVVITVTTNQLDASSVISILCFVAFWTPHVHTQALDSLIFAMNLA